MGGGGEGFHPNPPKTPQSPVPALAGQRCGWGGRPKASPFQHACRHSTSGIARDSLQLCPNLRFQLKPELRRAARSRQPKARMHPGTGGGLPAGPWEGGGPAAAAGGSPPRILAHHPPPGICRTPPVRARKQPGQASAARAGRGRRGDAGSELPAPAPQPSFIPPEIISFTENICLHY